MIRAYFSFWVFCWLILSIPIYGQLSDQRLNDLDPYFQGLSYFESGYYGLAATKFDEFLTQPRSHLNTKNIELVRSAELLQAKCALYENSPEAERLFVEFINKYRPSPHADEAALELALFYFNNRKYSESLDYFTYVNFGSISGVLRDEAFFKKGYAHYIGKEYRDAIQSLEKVSESEYYYPACYYAGHSHYFLDHYDQAIAFWQIAATSAEYSKSTPYNIAQVYFAQKKYDQLVIFTKPYVDREDLPNVKEIKYLTGKSFFELGDYKNAYKYLDEYALKRGAMTIDDYYQLGLSRYKAGQYQDAVDAFVKLDREETKIGQSAMYYLADCFTKLQDKSSARNAFYRVSRLDFDPKLQEEALLYYAKLSAELEFDIEAIKALLRFEPSSTNYVEAQTMTTDILARTNDTKRSLRLLEQMNALSPDLKKSYQLVAFRQGQKDLILRNKNEAKDYFERSLRYPIDNRLRALANFWLGEIYFKEDNYESSVSHINEYLALNPSQFNDLPPKASEAIAYYNLGYNYMKLEDFQKAQNLFLKSFKALPYSGLPDEAMIAIAADGGLRLADTYFKQKNYPAALDIYEENIEKEYDNYDYALYQKAIIEGLQRRNDLKVQTLEYLIQKQPNSRYADDALLRLGDTYGEMNRSGSAIAALEKLVNNYQGKSTLLPQAYLELGLINYNLGRTDLALTYYQKVFDNNPTPAEAKNALAAIQEIYLVDKQDPDAYLAFSQRVTGYKSTDTERDSLNYLIAMNLYEEGRYQEAASSFDSYIDKFPKGLYVKKAHYYQAESYSILKNYDAAVKAYEANIRFGQNEYYESSMQKAALIHYNYTKNFRKSYELYTELEQSTQNDNLKNEAQIGAFRSAYRVGLNNETLIYANKIIHNPEASDDLKHTAQFYIGKVDFDKENYVPARENLSSVAQHGSGENQAEAFYLLAYIDYQLQSIETAESSARKALTACGGYPYWVAKSLLLLADILIDQDDFFNARAAIDATLENYAEDPDIAQEAEAKRQRLAAAENANNEQNKDQ